MPGDDRLLLLHHLRTHYGDLVRRLQRSLGSTDAAAEALHDAYLKLESSPAIGAVHSPHNYLLRMALNLGRNRARANRRLAESSAIEAALSIEDEAPGPDRIVQGRFDHQKVVAALERLPERRRMLFLASWDERLSVRKISERHGVHIRVVQREIRRAADELKEILFDDGPAARRESYGEVSKD